MNLISRKVNRSGLRISHSKVFSSDYLENSKKKKDKQPSIYISDHCIIVIFVDMQLITKVYSCVLIKLLNVFYLPEM